MTSKTKVSQRPAPTGEVPLGRAVGGHARAASLTPERRQEIAKLGGKARQQRARVKAVGRA